nr:hypothetical protein [Tanacetum cinerariifolium]
WQWEHITGSGKTALEVGMDRTFNSQQSYMIFLHVLMSFEYADCPELFDITTCANDPMITGIVIWAVLAIWILKTMLRSLWMGSDLYDGYGAYQQRRGRLVSLVQLCVCWEFFDDYDDGHVHHLGCILAWSLCSETLIKKILTRRTLYSLKEIDLESAQNNAVAKLPLLKQGDYEMWKLRIEQYFQVQDYALWDVIENGNSFKPVPRITTNADGTSTLTIPGPVTTKEKAQKKNDVKARSMLLMALPNEHLLTLNQYKDAKTFFDAIQARFDGYDTTKKTQKTLLKQMYENFNAPSTETPISTFSTHDNTANLSNATMYSFLANQPNGSQLVHEDLEQIHEDDLEEMDLKSQLALLSMRAIRSPRNQESGLKNQDSSRKTVNVEDTSFKAMVAIDGAGLFAPPTIDLSNSGLEEFQHPKFKGYEPKVSKSVCVDTSNEIKKAPDAPIIKDWVSDSDEDEFEVMVLKSNNVQHKLEKANQPRKDSQNPRNNRTNLNEMRTQKLGVGFQFTKKACFVCGIFSHLIKDCDFHDKKMVQKPVLKNVEKETGQREVRPVWNNTMRINHQNFSNSKRIFAPTAVLTKSGIVLISTARQSSSRAAAPVSAARPNNTAAPKPLVNVAKSRQNALLKTHSLKNRNLNNKINTTKVNSVHTAKGNRVTSAVGKQGINAVKSSACWVWRPKIKVQDHVSKNSDLQDALKDQGYFDSGCYRHMTGNVSYLSDFKEHNGGYVTFGGGAKGGKITGKGTIRTGKLDVEDVYFVKELQFNLFSVSQIFTWVFFLAIKNETSRILKSFITETENLVDKKVKIIRCDNGTEFNNRVMNEFYEEKSIKREYNMARTPQQNKLGKFDGKLDDEIFVGYSTISKAFRVYNTRTRKVEENLHITFLEYKPMITDGTNSNDFAGKESSFNACQSSLETGSNQDYILMPLWKDNSLFDSSSQDSDGYNKDKHGPSQESKCDNQKRPNAESSTKTVNTAGPSINTANANDNTGSDIGIFNDAYDDRDEGAEAVYNNLETVISVSPIPFTRVHKDHPKDQIIGKMEPKKVTRALDDESWIEAMIEAIRLFFAYASFMDFTMYQIDVKSTFLYDTIEEKVYVSQPPGFVDPEFPDMVYKVEKALYCLHQAPRVWYETLSTYLLENRFIKGTIDKTLFIKKIKNDILLVQVVKSAITPMKTHKPLSKDANGTNVDVHLYRINAVGLSLTTVGLRLMLLSKADTAAEETKRITLIGLDLSKLDIILNWLKKIHTKGTHKCLKPLTLHHHFLYQHNKSLILFHPSNSISWKKGEYNIWAMKMEHYLSHTDYPIWQVIQNGNGHVSVTTDTNGMIKVLPPKTAEEVVAREKERKARTALLMALPEDHLAKFHKMADAKEMWKAIKSIFGGNDELKKMQKYLLKQQFKGFSVSASEGLHKGYDRSLPFSWSQVALIMRTKPGLDTLSFDDLCNNLRVFERDVKGTNASSSNTQNVAFVSADNASSTNDVSTAYSVSSPSVSKSQKEGSSSYTDEVIHSFFANQSSAPQLDYDDLEQINNDDMEEIDLKWQVAMISMRIKKFHKRTGRKLKFDTKDPVGFDKTKVECFNCHKMGNFARDCKAKDLDDKTDVLAYHKKLLAEALKEKEDLKTKFENWQNSSKNLSRLLNTQMNVNDKFGLGYGNYKYGSILSYENEVLQSVFMNKESNLENTSVNDRYAEGIHAVPPPMTGNYMPYGPDVEIDYSIFTNVPKQTSVDESDAMTSEYTSCESDSSVETTTSMLAPVDNAPKVICEPKVEHVKETCTPNHRPKVEKQDRNGHTRKGLGYAFTRKTCFVCGSFSHLIRDCDFHENRMAKQAALTKSKNKDDLHKALKDKGIVYSRCFRHMTGNKAHLADYQEFKGGSVAFRGSNGRITRKGKIKTGKLDFEDNKVLFTDTDCLVLSPDFKLPNENQVLLKNPRQHNMYSFNLKNIDHSEDLSCLFAKALIDESNKWHKRLGHVNFKNLNKLVKENLVRGLPSKIFENDHTCVACQKGKQHKASCLKEANNSACTQANDDQGANLEEFDLHDEYFVLPIWSAYSTTEELKKLKRQEKEANDVARKDTFHENQNVNTNVTNLLNAVSTPISTAGPSRAFNDGEPLYPNDPSMPHLEDIYASPSERIFADLSYDDEGVIRSKVNKNSEAHALISQALEDESWVDAMQEELLHFQIQKKSWCDELEELMKNMFQMSSMGKLTFFLGLHVKQKEDGIFISQDKYLKGQPKSGLWYPKVSSFDLEAYSDSDYAGVNLDRKSITEDYRFNIMNIKIYIDNESTICIVKNPVFHSETKHIEIRHHFIWDAYEKNFIQVLKIHTDDNVADLLTKAFDATFSIKKVNDVVKLRALIDGKKVVVSEDVIRQDIHLDDTDGVECLPNEEIFTELARMGYEKPPPKLTFYKAFFSAQWKFLIHNLIQCISAKRMTWNEFSCSMASAVICLATCDLSSHTNQYTSPALTQKVFANMRRVGKGFSGVKTLLFATMIVQPPSPAIEEEADVKVHDAHTSPSSTNTSSPPQQEPITLPPQAQPAPLSSPPQEQPTTTFKSSMSILNTLMETWRRIEAIDADEEITLVYMEIQVDLGMTYEKVRPIFKREYNKVQTLFKPDKDEEPTKKRVAEEALLQESFKKFKAVEVLGSHSTQDTLTDDPKEMSEEDVKNMLQIVPIPEFKVKALHVKFGGITQAYQSFKDMLKDFDKEDLDALWRLVKEKFSTAVPTVDKEKALWKFHSNCGVHQVSSTTKRHDMFMLIEKDYPLSNGVMTLMLSTKLQVEEDSEMARDLLMKIFMKANQSESKRIDVAGLSLTAAGSRLMLLSKADTAVEETEGITLSFIKIHMDNESAICVVKNPVYNSKTKHIEIRHHFIRDSYEKRLIEMVKIHTDYNVADLHTKAFDVTRF